MSAPHDAELQKMLNGSSSYVVFGVMSGPTRSFPTALEPYLNLTGTMAIFQWAKATNLRKEDNLVGPNSTLEAVRCTVYFSVKEVVPLVTNGVYSEQVLREINHPEPVHGLIYSSNDIDSIFASVP